VFDMITTNAARALRLPDYGIEPGCRADLVLIEADNVRDAFRLLPPRRAVFYGGRLVAEASATATRHRAGD
jgi:cytosine deaminase